ncbi:hypothetical protein [Herpetosiphon llansteffanensis]|uniref:hypothetical protein n=1 Tax=Herpetosiphon llansteffanensis TaxID=2094568 RepID=UPI000D7BA0FD|nr:hypothetical protein [Herpetosiphon llansteffanensis]
MVLRRILGIVTAALAVVTLSVQPRSTTAAEPIKLDTQCFDVPGITNCLNDKFLTYWNGNGGLPVFGYPITAAANEVNADTQQSYLTQWLERNRFELHPENAGTPYEVLLGLLGKERLAQLNRQVEPREAGPVDGCLWFEQTGHNVCNQAGDLGFKSYWQSHGLKIDGLDTYARSLQLFGLPLTSAQTETNANGDTVVTQWFERARLEWHPSNPDEFKVLLGLLGKEIIDGRSQPIPSPTPAPIPSPTPTPAPSPTPTDPCASTPEPISARISPAKCGPAGTVFSFDLYGFQANEDVGFWFTDPDGINVGTADTTNIGPQGAISGLQFNTRGLYPGTWQFTMQGVSSGHASVVYFTITQ